MLSCYSNCISKLAVGPTVLDSISWGQQPSRKLLHTRGSSNFMAHLEASPRNIQELNDVECVGIISPSGGSSA